MAAYPALTDMTGGAPFLLPVEQGTTPLRELDGGKSPHGPQPQCAACHRAHTAVGEELLVEEGASLAICTRCHTRGGEEPKSTHSNVDYPYATQAPFVLSCTACHDPHRDPDGPGSQAMIRSQIGGYDVRLLHESGEDVVDSLCVVCHTTTSHNNVYVYSVELWRLLTSVRLALILILLITLAVLAGTLIDQAPQGVLGNSEAYARWLDQARSRYGSWIDLMGRLQLFRVFSSIWFRFLVAALAVNIIVCTMNRWGSIRAAVFRPRVRMNPAYFERARTTTAFSVALPLSEASAAVRQELRKAGYRTLVRQGPPWRCTRTASASRASGPS